MAVGTALSEVDGVGSERQRDTSTPAASIAKLLMNCLRENVRTERGLILLSSTEIEWSCISTSYVCACGASLIKNNANRSDKAAAPAANNHVIAGL